MNAIKICSRIALTASLLLTAFAAYSNPVACFDSNLGRFCIELFEPRTPITVANFRNYIDSGTYTNGIFHRSLPGFVVQGGGFKLVDTASGKQLSAVNTFPPIFNEFGISNKRGTVAMAKTPTNPNSATSQWFVNLADNSQNLDYQNGGFTVFGRVLFDGMTVIDTISALPVVNLGGSLTAIPLIDYNGSQTQVSNFVQIDQVNLIDTTAVFHDGALSFPVDVGTGEALSVNLRLIEHDSSYLFEVDLTNIAVLPSRPENIALFSSHNNQLLIPVVMLNSNTLINNVVLQLTDAQSLRFTLTSYELPN